jgi:hypothetical protein
MNGQNAADGQNEMIGETVPQRREDDDRDEDRNQDVEIPYRFPVSHSPEKYRKPLSSDPGAAGMRFWELKDFTHSDVQFCRVCALAKECTATASCFHTTKSVGERPMESIGTRHALKQSKPCR